MKKSAFLSAVGRILQCTNESCGFKKSMACVTIDSLTRKLMLVGCVKNRTNIFRVLPGSILQSGRRNYLCIIAVNTCPFTAYSERATDDVRRKVAENPDATPAQIQTSVILTKLRQCRDWSEVKKAAASVSDKRWISNEKARMKQKNEPYGHD